MNFVQKRLAGLGVLVLLAGLGAAAVWWQQRRASGEQESKQAEEKVLAVKDPTSVRAVELATPKGSFSVVRAGEGEWKLTAPLETTAEATTIDGMLDHLTQLTRTRLVGAQAEGEGVTPPAELEPFALDPPRFTVTLELDNGGTETLLVGKRAAFDGSVYVKLPQRPEVMVVPGGIEYQVDKDLFELREKRLAVFDPEEVTKLAVSVGGEPAYTVERQGEDYQIVSPRRAPAERVQVTGILSALGNLRAKSFASESSEPAELAASGLAPPRAQVELTMKSGATLSLLLGQVDRAGVAVHFAARAGGGPIVEVSSEWALKKVLTRAVELVDKHVLRFDRDQVRSLTLTAGATVLSFEKRHDEEEGRDLWHMTAPEAAPAQDAVVAGLIYKLWSLQASAILNEEAADAQLEAAGMKAPTLRVDLFGAEGAVVGGILFGNEAEGSRYAVAAGGRRLGLVDEDTVEEISTSAEAYREKKADAEE